MTDLLVRSGLLEREHELRRLDSLVDDALAGRGAVVVVDGPAGIGKTRLLDAAREAAARAGCRVLAARGSDLERSFPYGVVRQLLEPVVRDAVGGGRSALLTGEAEHASAVFAPIGGADDDPALDTSGAIVHGLFGLVSHLAEREPLLITVDDAHWADTPSLVFLGFLTRRLDALRVAVVIASRRGERGREAELVRQLMTDSAGASLDLAPLTMAATADLVRSLLGDVAPDEVCAACHAATDGNPFLVQELARALGVEGALRPGAAERVGRLVPDTVARQVLVRLSRIGPDAVRVARSLAILGPSAQIRHAAALTGLGPVEAAAAVDLLASAGILAPGPALGFVHPILVEAIYADMLPGERRLAHAAAARVLADAGSRPDRVALQLVAAEPAGSEWAVDILRLAAADATARGAPDVAAAYLERAVEEPPTPADRPALLFELGVAEIRAGRTRAADHLLEAWRLTGDSVGRAAIAAELAEFNYMRGQFDDSAMVLEEAIDLLPERGSEAERVRFSLEAEAGVLATTLPEVRRRLGPRLAALRAQAPALLAVPAAAPLLAVMAEELTVTDGTAREAIAYAQRAFEDGELLSREGCVVAVGGVALVIADRPTMADGILDLAVSAARSRGSIRAMRAALVSRAFARNRLGRIADAEADARLTLGMSTDESFDMVRPFRVSQLADALIEAGRIDAARDVVCEAELARRDHESKLYQPLRDTHARLLLLEGRPREARAVVDAELAWQRDWGGRNPGWTSARTWGALADRALGRLDEAGALAHEDLAAARAFGARRAIGVALRTVATVGEQPSLDLLRESAAVLEESEAPLELARTLVELGAALRRGGNRRDSRRPLQRALDIADGCGGALVAEAARVELAASGARPRPRRSTGPDTLTPSERRVAVLAEQGLSNREIAQSLFLSTKTVEMHLGHVYRKLGIHSRAGLVAAIAAAVATVD
jgi:DNA-binding CsgD family transcriptional regulator